MNSVGSKIFTRIQSLTLIRTADIDDLVKQQQQQQKTITHLLKPLENISIDSLEPSQTTDIRTGKTNLTENRRNQQEYKDSDNIVNTEEFSGSFRNIVSNTNDGTERNMTINKQAGKSCTFYIETES